MSDIKDTIKSIYDMDIEKLSNEQIQEMIMSLDTLHLTVKDTKILKLQDKNKRLTLTDEQYKTWLDTDVAHINTEQFAVLYGFNKRKQTELRSRIQDPLPSFQIDGKGQHYYNKIEVDKWLSNHKRLNPFK